MNINEQIKQSMKNYMTANSENKAQAKFELDTMKLLKTTFMEYVTNKKNAKQFDINDDVSLRITKIPEDVQIKLISDMIKERRNNVEVYTKANRLDMANKEKTEADILETLLPKAASKEDIEKFVKENYPDGIEQKQMGMVIGQIKKVFERVDGKVVADVVKTFINK